MLLMAKFLPDCCEQCCDHEKVDPQKDRVLINMQNTMPSAQQEKTSSKDPRLFGKDPVKPKNVQGADLATSIDQAKLNELHEVRRRLEDAALVEKRKIECQQQEDCELRQVREIAEAAEVQEAVEAQDLLEAQQASMRDHQKLTKSQDAQRYEEQLLQDRSMKEQRLKEEAEDQSKIDTFLWTNGFVDMDSKKKSLFKTFYPLHAAVTQSNAEMVQLLLAAGARPTLKNSAGRSPLQLALKLDKKGSHEQIIKFLQFGL